MKNVETLKNMEVQNFIVLYAKKIASVIEIMTNEIEIALKMKDYPNVEEYYKHVFELIGDLGVDEIMYKYTGSPTFHEGWHFTFMQQE